MNVCGTANDGDCSNKGGAICQWETQGTGIYSLGSVQALPQPTWQDLGLPLSLRLCSSY